jgi:hypothetical protein
MAAIRMLIRTAGNRPVFSMPQDIDKREVPTVVFHIANLETRKFQVPRNGKRKNNNMWLVRAIRLEGPKCSRFLERPDLLRFENEWTCNDK